MSSVSIHDLAEDELSALFQAFDGESRVSQISLTCKTWLRVTRAHPYQPKQLVMQPKHLVDASFVTYHKDHRKLEELRVLSGKRPGTGLSEICMRQCYWDSVVTLLGDLHDNAPAMRILELILPFRSPMCTGYRQTFAALPLVCRLIGLRHLALRHWRLTKNDVASFSHLKRLQSLEVLELSDISLEFPKPSAADWGFLGTNSLTAYKDSVGLAFQEALSGLSCLTSLSLSKVAFMHYMPRPPEQAVSLTKLRSLTFDQRGDVLRLHPPPAGQYQLFPELAAMTDLSHLNLECQWAVDGKAEPLLEALASLSGLRELTLTRCKAMRRLIVPSEAELTKISLDSSELEEGEFDEYLHLLTLEQKLHLYTLRNVRDLYLRCFTHPVWPEWAPLTNLTRLALHFGANHPASIVPGFVGELRGLKDVELTATYSSLMAERGWDKLTFMMINLPALERLQVDIAAVDVDRYRGLRQDEIQNLEGACREVLKTVRCSNVHRVLHFTVIGVLSQNTADLADPEAEEARLVFTFDPVKGL